MVVLRMPEPVVSVLIPVYNREKLIVPCIRSALDQTLREVHGRQPAGEFHRGSLLATSECPLD